MVASKGMIGLSHSFKEEDQDYLLSRVVYRHQVEKALTLQLEVSDEDYDQLYARWKKNQRSKWLDAGFSDDDYDPGLVAEFCVDTNSAPHMSFLTK
jgi:hypothetical protein